MTTDTHAAWASQLLDDVGADLDRRSLVHCVSDDTILVRFEHRDGRRFGVAFVAGGDPRGRHGREGRARAARVSATTGRRCSSRLNNWNATTTGPKAHLAADDWVTDETATVFLEHWLPVPESGACDATQRRAVVDAMLRSCALFVLPDLLADVRS